MALYLGNNKVSMKSGYTTTGFKDFLERGGRFSGTNYTDLTGILKYEDTENVSNMANIFSSCEQLTTIPELNTSNAISMRALFMYCKNLLSIPKLDTSNVTETGFMFYYCEKLTSIPQLNTSNDTAMNNMFHGCNNLLSIPQLNSSKVTNMNNMFNGCTNLSIIPQLDASKATGLTDTFKSCSKLEQIHMTGMKVSFNISASTLFTRDALLEILNNLATITDTKTLTMGSTNLAKLTDEDKSIATNKGWTLA